MITSSAFGEGASRYQPITITGHNMKTRKFKSTPTQIVYNHYRKVENAPVEEDGSTPRHNSRVCYSYWKGRKSPKIDEISDVTKEFGWYAAWCAGVDVQSDIDNS